MPQTDVLILSVPLAEGTHRPVDGECLLSLNDGVLLDNLARGAGVDTKAPPPELDEGRVRADLDVTAANAPGGTPLRTTPTS
nr:NAD(P)-dependent oxidoreductase [Streptomyces chromofuscus]